MMIGNMRNITKNGGRPLLAWWICKVGWTAKSRLWKHQKVKSRMGKKLSTCQFFCPSVAISFCQVYFPQMFRWNKSRLIVENSHLPWYTFWFQMKYFSFLFILRCLRGTLVGCFAHSFTIACLLNPSFASLFAYIYAYATN